MDTADTPRLLDRVLRNQRPAEPLAERCGERRLSGAGHAGDDDQNGLFDELGTGDIEWSRKLGGATYALLFLLARQLLQSGQHTIVEANMFVGSAEPELESLPPHRTLQIHCSAPLDVLQRRVATRLDRHHGHLDSLRAAELEARDVSGVHTHLTFPELWSRSIRPQPSTSPY